LERTIRHTRGCPKCARGEGHHVFVLTVTYPGGRTRQLRAFPEKAESMDSHSIASQIQGSDWQEASMDGKALFGRFAQTSG
jgi:hypothetical protein